MYVDDVAPTIALPSLYHWYELIPAGPLSDSLAPAQITPVPVDVMTAVGGVFTVTDVADVVVEQPSAFITVTL